MNFLLRELFFKSPKKKYVQLFRFIFLSLFCTSIDYFLLYVLTEQFKIHYLISSVIGYTFGFILSYMITISWVFYKRKVKNKFLEFNMFLFTAILPLILVELLMFTLVEIFDIYYMLSRFISSVTIYFFKFNIRKKLLF